MVEGSLPQQLGQEVGRGGGEHQRVAGYSLLSRRKTSSQGDDAQVGAGPLFQDAAELRQDVGMAHIAAADVVVVAAPVAVVVVTTAAVAVVVVATAAVAVVIIATAAVAAVAKL